MTIFGTQDESARAQKLSGLSARRLPGTGTIFRFLAMAIVAGGAVAAPASADTTRTQINFTITVSQTCAIQAYSESADFGNIGLVSAATQQKVHIEFACPDGVQFSLDAKGSHDDATGHYLVSTSNPNDKIPYRICWGSACPPFPRTGTANGSTNANDLLFDIAALPAGSGRRIGHYTDVVTLTLAF